MLKQMLKKWKCTLNNFVHFESFFQSLNKTRQGNIIMKAKGLQPRKKYNNPLVIYCPGCHDSDEMVLGT